MAYDLLRNVHKTTYALNVECQTDANITIEPESENVVYEDMSLCNSWDKLWTVCDMYV